MSALRVFTFSADCVCRPQVPLISAPGLAQPAWIPYEQIFQDDTRKGPKEEPRIELDG